MRNSKKWEQGKRCQSISHKPQAMVSWMSLYSVVSETEVKVISFNTKIFLQ